MNLSNMTSEHWFLIPSVFFLGLVLGFLLGQIRRPLSRENDL